MPLDDLQMESVWPADAVKLDFLYQLMQERLDEPTSNISHEKMPTETEHVSFVMSHPYHAWYTITTNGKFCGAIYLSKKNEVAIYVRSEFRRRGVATRALKWLLLAHPRGRYFANVNTENTNSVAMFRSLGFRALQLTMIRQQ